MIWIGNFFFHYRNYAFPLIIVLLFATAIPPSTTFGSEAGEELKDIVGLLLAMAGLGLRALVIGYAYIKRGGLKKRVYAETLVTEGIFGLCRNPLYLGNLMIYSGILLVHGNPLVVAVGVTAFLFIYQSIVLAEEAYLEEKFGDGYRAYCRDVPRWIPRLSNFSAATEGMKFNLRRVVFKDYPTIASTTIILALTEAYEYIPRPQLDGRFEYLIFLACVIVLAVSGAAAMRIVKRRYSA